MSERADAGLAQTSLAAWVDSVTGQHVEALVPIPGGGSRNTYVVDTADRARYLLRVDNGLGPLSKTIFTIGREYRILSALHAAGRAVPAIHHYSESHAALLMEFIHGKTSYQVSADAGAPAPHPGQPDARDRGAACARRGGTWA